jgi:hypothetical protein
MIIRGASWCDLVKHVDGRVELVMLIGSTVDCAGRWSVDARHSLLYLSAAADRKGRVLAAGQGEDRAGTIRTAIEGTLGTELGGSAFPFSVLVRGESDGWTVFIQRTSRSYDEVRVAGDGRVLSTDPRTFAALDPERPEQSQGFLYIREDGQPVTQDQGRNAIFGLTLPSPAPGGSVWVGQSAAAATIALADLEAGTIHPLGTPGGQPPHIVESGGTYYVCSYVDGPAAWLSTHRRPFAAVTPPIEPPPVEPPPVNPPQEQPVRLEQKHSDVIEAFAARFHPPGGDEDALRDHWTPRLVEQMVFSFPGEGWCWKSTSPGSRPSSDVIARRVGGGMWGYDLIPNAGTSSWRLDAHAGPIDLRTQAPIPMNPVNHLGTAPPVTPPTQPPTQPPAQVVDLSPVLAELRALRGEVQALREAHDGHERASEQRYQNHGDQHRLMNEVLARLDARR